MHMATTKGKAAKTAKTSKRKSAPKTTRRTLEPLNAICRNRVANIRELIKLRFRGRATDLAKALGRSDNYVWQLLHGYRAVGEVTARYMEEKLELGLNALDARKVFEPTTVLTAQVGNGMSISYYMVPHHSLENVTKNLGNYRVAPVPCSGDAFYAEITGEGVEGLEPGEIAFVDRGDANLQHDSLYVVMPKGFNGSAGTVVRAKKLDGNRWRFVNKVDTFESSQLRAVVGRVVTVMRSV